MDSSEHRIRRFTYDIIYGVLWIIEAFLLARFVLKLLGANSGNLIIEFVYSVAGAFMGPFANMFSEGRAGSVVLDPSVLIAMVAYAIIAYLLVSLISVLTPHSPQNP